MRKQHLTEIVFIVAALVLVSITSIIMGVVDGSPTPVPTMSYCQQIGDDNCDGMMTPNESGWVCVPPNGGPLLCEVGVINE